MIKRVVEEVVRRILDEWRPAITHDTVAGIVNKVQAIYELDANKQYLINVDDDETARLLVESMQKTFSVGSKVVIFTGNVRIIEISKNPEV